MSVTLSDLTSTQRFILELVAKVRGGSVCPAEAGDIRRCESLERLGLLRRSEDHVSWPTFHVTDEGKRAIGVEPEEGQP